MNRQSKNIKLLVDGLKVLRLIFQLYFFVNAFFLPKIRHNIVEETLIQLFTHRAYKGLLASPRLQSTLTQG
jgi:hypothetical protein